MDPIVKREHAECTLVSESEPYSLTDVSSNGGLGKCSVCSAKEAQVVWQWPPGWLMTDCQWHRSHYRLSTSSACHHTHLAMPLSSDSEEHVKRLSIQLQLVIQIKLIQHSTIPQHHRALKTLRCQASSACPSFHSWAPKNMFGFVQ